MKKKKGVGAGTSFGCSETMPLSNLTQVKDMLWLMEKEP